MTYADVARRPQRGFLEDRPRNARALLRREWLRGNSFVIARAPADSLQPGRGHFRVSAHDLRALAFHAVAHRCESAAARRSIRGNSTMDIGGSLQSRAAALRITGLRLHQ